MACSALGRKITDVKSRSGREAECQFDGRTPGPSRADGDSSLMGKDNLLDDGQPEAGAAGAGREEGTKHLVALRRWDARAVVLHRHAAGPVCAVHAAIDNDRWCPADRLARFGGVPEQVAEHLPEKRLVTLDL